MTSKFFNGQAARAALAAAACVSLMAAAAPADAKAPAPSGGVAEPAQAKKGAPVPAAKSAKGASRKPSRGRKAAKSAPATRVASKAEAARSRRPLTAPRAPENGPLSWFSAPRHLRFALPIAVSNAGANPSIKPQAGPTPHFMGAEFAALDFWGRPVGVARGGQFASTPAGSWSPWGFRRASGSMGARVFVPKARSASLPARAAEGFVPSRAERAALAKAVRAAEIADAKSGAGCGRARSNSGGVTYFRELAARAPAAADGRRAVRAGHAGHVAADHAEPPSAARFAVLPGACVRVMELRGRTWHARGALLAQGLGETRGDAARVSAVLDMDGDAIPEIVTEVRSRAEPKAEPDTVVVRFDSKRGAYRVAAHFVDSGP